MTPKSHPNWTGISALKRAFSLTIIAQFTIQLGLLSSIHFLIEFCRSIFFLNFETRVLPCYVPRWMGSPPQRSRRTIRPWQYTSREGNRRINSSYFNGILALKRHFHCLLRTIRFINIVCSLDWSCDRIFTRSNFLNSETR